ncbi:DMT family transporter [Mangrovibacterium diazotrophicum]|uniref:EamA-like transporter family protein n=1 Tax=Mangrovibacterium diazotrophicum TaxID=1261403 RepID=A0A419W6Z5_9BACT|nr:EamA family transporter [Mangrovibacterium diazotrophicum]RKD91229.1 EamA-like transporter family protein [Mangrovibacterium diazotrophicum]
MKTRSAILFLVPTLIWGSTWYAIKFQVGTIDPLVSVSYRFMLAGILLLAYCKIAGLNLRFNIKQHGMIALLGLLLFGVNYWMVYEAETILTSGLVAVMFSIIILANIFLNALLLKGVIRKEVLLGASLGILGTALLFKDDLLSFNLNNQNLKALLICIAGVLFASLGNITSALNQRNKLPVIQTNAFAMTYGGLMMFGTVLILQKEIAFEYTTSYVLSLFYLAIFGSIIAFSTYLQLLGEIGPDRSAYVALITPVIALFISTFFEGYEWKMAGILGAGLLIAGNVIALKNKLIKKQIRA